MDCFVFSSKDKELLLIDLRRDSKQCDPAVFGCYPCVRNAEITLTSNRRLWQENEALTHQCDRATAKKAA